MKEKLRPYRWLAYVLVWYIFQMFPAYFRMTSTSVEFLILLFLLSVLVISICSYKFGSEMGKVLGIMMFLVGVIIDVFVSFLTFGMLLGMSWHN